MPIFDLAANVKSTPFSRWREGGRPDPFGNRFNNGYEKLTHGNLNHERIAKALIYFRSDFMFIGWLTAGKERLRWLSRSLYKLANEHDAINQERATLPKGHLSDDELANLFFMTEDKDDLQAGHDRIMWLVEKIKQHSKQAELTHD